MNTFKLSCIFSVVFIAACAPRSPESQLPTEHQPHGTMGQPAESKIKKQANSISSWEISGAMAARQQNKGWSASLDWVQQGTNQYQIHLSGPLGGGAVLVEKRGTTVTYTDGPKKVVSHDADALLKQQTGIRLPVNDLYYWVRGLPAPGAVQSLQKENGHLLALKQAGYTINYTHYMSVNGVDLPGKIQLQGHNVVIKLVIKRWRI